MNKPVIKVDVVSDVVCPWCYIGKRRLEKAIDQLKDEFDFSVTYHPFELNPQTPKEGVNHKTYLTNKFGGEARYEQISNHVKNIAAQEGLNFVFSDHLIAPNTLDAHRLIAFAKQHGKQHEIKEALMSAYFEKNIDLTQTENLVSLATEHGLDETFTRQFLSSDQLTAEVKMEEQINHQRGISGVPFYIINDQYGVSGAQPNDVFVKIFSEIGQQLSQATGETCAVESGDC